MADLFGPGLGRVHHRGYCVESIEDTVAKLADQFGAGPFFRSENVPLENVTSRGDAARFDHDSAFGYLGEDPIELMKINSISPAGIDRRFAGPLPRLHHVAWVMPADSVESVREDLDRRGVSEYLHAHLGDIDFTYHDGSSPLGHDVEIHRECAALEGFFGMFRAARDGWDGSEPLRTVE